MNTVFLVLLFIHKVRAILDIPEILVKGSLTPGEKRHQKL